MKDIFDKPESWYEERRICFDAEAGYNVLSGPHVAFHEQDECEHVTFSKVDGHCLGVFLDTESGSVLAAYMATNEGVFLIKNPTEEENSLAGKTNALRFNEEGQPEIYYHKCGNGWAYGRPAKTVKEQGHSDVEILKIDKNFPGIEYILEIEPHGIAALIPELEKFGYQISPDSSIEEVLLLISANPPARSGAGYKALLEQLTNLYLAEAK